MVIVLMFQVSWWLYDDCVYVSGIQVVVMLIVFMFQVFRWLS